MKAFPESFNWRETNCLEEGDTIPWAGIPTRTERNEGSGKLAIILGQPSTLAFFELTNLKLGGKPFRGFKLPQALRRDWIFAFQVQAEGLYLCVPVARGFSHLR